MAVPAETGVQLESDAVPALVPLVKGVDEGEAVERVVLEVELLVALASHDKVKGEFPELFKVKELVGCLFLE